MDAEITCPKCGDCANPFPYDDKMLSVVPNNTSAFLACNNSFWLLITIGILFVIWVTSKINQVKTQVFDIILIFSHLYPKKVK